jgi:hypothetical protein
MAKQNPSGKKQLGSSIAIILMLFLTVLSLGCTEELEEPVDKTSIYVYEEEMGQEGDPQEDIKEFYEWVSTETGDDEKAGPPVLVPVQEYGAEFDPETGEIINIYDSDDNPLSEDEVLALKDRVIRDEEGKIITDASQLDLHIQPIGKNEYKILNLPQEMQDADGKTWKISHDIENRYGGDTKFNDDIIKIGDHDDMYGGFVRGDDGKPYGVIVIDEDAFEWYYDNFGIRAKGDNAAHGIKKEDCIDLGGGLHVYVYDLPEGGAGVQSIFPRDSEIKIAKKMVDMRPLASHIHQFLASSACRPDSDRQDNTPHDRSTGTREHRHRNSPHDASPEACSFNLIHKLVLVLSAVIRSEPCHRIPPYTASIILNGDHEWFGTKDKQ